MMEPPGRAQLEDGDWEVTGKPPRLPRVGSGRRTATPAGPDLDLPDLHVVMQPEVVNVALGLEVGQFYQQTHHN